MKISAGGSTGNSVKNTPWKISHFMIAAPVDMVHTFWEKVRDSIFDLCELHDYSALYRDSLCRSESLCT